MNYLADLFLLNINNFIDITLNYIHCTGMLCGAKFTTVNEYLNVEPYKLALELTICGPEDVLETSVVSNIEVIRVDGKLMLIDKIVGYWPLRSRTFWSIWQYRCKIIKMHPELKDLNLFNIHRFDDIKDSWTKVQIPEIPEFYQFSARIGIHLMEPGAGGLISETHVIYY